MTIKKISLVKVDDGGLLRAYVTILFETFCVWDVKVIERREGLDVVLPTKKKKTGDKIMHYPYIKFMPEEWKKIKTAVLVEYNK